MSSEDLFIKKLAGPTMTRAAKFVSQHPSAVAAPIGAAAAVALQLFRNRKKDSGLSAEQEDAIARLRHAEANQRPGEDSFSKDLSVARARSQKEIAEVLTKHPYRGALLAAPAGALTAGSLVALGQRLAKLAK
jgi:hypothetical protein